MTYDTLPIELIEGGALRMAAATLRRAARVSGRKRLAGYERQSLEAVAEALHELAENAAS